jgi:hypothetical protein
MISLKDGTACSIPWDLRPRMEAYKAISEKVTGK